MENNENFIETRSITLPKGCTLEIKITQELLDRIRYQFQIDKSETVTDDHMRMFIWGAVSTALDKAEKEMKDG